MRLTRSLIVAVSLVAACSPPAPDSDAPSVAAEQQFHPSSEMRTAFHNCRWGDVHAGGVGIYSYACPNARLVGDETLPGFRLVTTGPDGAETQTVVIRIFAKPPDAPINSVLDAVRSASPGPDTATCVLEPAGAGLSSRAPRRFLLMPTGAARVAWEAYMNLESDEGGAPCGPLSVTENVRHTFEILDGAPDKVVYVDWGSNLQVYAPETLHAVP